MKTKYNPERRTWRGRSYKKHGQRISELKEKNMKKTIVESRVA